MQVRAAGISLFDIARLFKQLVALAHGVEMVAPKHDDGGLVHIAEIIHQSAQSRVRLIHARCKILQLGKRLRGKTGMLRDLHQFVRRVTACVVGRVVLHRHRMDEKRCAAVPRFVFLNNALRHGCVRDKAAAGVRVHKILGGDELVKAEVGVRSVAAPELAVVSVHGQRIVALRPQILRQRKHIMGDMLLIGLAARRQMLH